MSHQDGLEFLWGEPDLLRYDRPLFAKTRVIEGGGRNAVGFAALEASVDSLLHLGIKALHSHVQGIHNALESGMQGLGFQSVRALDPQARSGILSFLPPGNGPNLKELMPRLSARGLSVSSPDSHLRVSPGWPNGVPDAQATIEIVGESMEEFHAQEL